MIYFYSHFESISGRDYKRLLKELLPVLLWNNKVLSSFIGVKYVFICDDNVFNLISPLYPGEVINIKQINNDLVEEKRQLVSNFEKVSFNSELNYGIEFERKCFERFLYIKNLAMSSTDDFFFHIDCDLLISRSGVESLIRTLTKSTAFNMPIAKVFTVSPYSTFLSGFNSLAINQFCDFFLYKYSLEPNRKYRYCDMGALNLFISDKTVNNIQLFPNMDFSFLSPDLMSFQPFLIHVAGLLGISKDDRCWWSMTEISDCELTDVLNHKIFFKTFPDQSAILRNSCFCDFIHFHGPTKRLISHMITT